jgi:hypothetical protein
VNTQPKNIALRINTSYREFVVEPRGDRDNRVGAGFGEWQARISRVTATGNREIVALVSTEERAVEIADVLNSALATLHDAAQMLVADRDVVRAQRRSFQRRRRRERGAEA